MKPGSLVVCVDDTNWHPNAFKYMSGLPVKGRVYQISKMKKSVLGPDEPDAVSLVGFTGRWVLYEDHKKQIVYVECSFRQYRFAEIMPPITDTEEVEDEEMMEMVN